MRRTTPLDEIPALVKKWCGYFDLEIEAKFESSGNELLFPNRMSLIGQDAQYLLSDRSAPLEALQYLIQEIQSEKDSSRLVYLDVKGIRLFRMRELVAMADIAAQKARETGSYVFDSLTPKERRWIHLTIGKEGDLETYSEGLGSHKRLKVSRKA